MQNKENIMKKRIRLLGKQKKKKAKRKTEKESIKYKKEERVVVV